MKLVDWLDDLCVRFIINLPQEELESVERICFQIEEAQWFYEDFVRPLDPTLPSLSLRQFSLSMFQHCPLLANFSEYHHLTAYAEFLAYKTRVPVRGAIMLNDAMDHVLLVKGWKKGANWSFPRGKINKDEKDLDCAIREVYEETGFDIRAADLVPDESKAKFIEVTLREQHLKLYVFRGVSLNTHFQPRTRKEISKIQWYRLSDLPSFKKKAKPSTQQPHVEDMPAANKFYMVAPFLGPLKKWIAQQKKLDARAATVDQHFLPYDHAVDQSSAMEDDFLTAEETDHFNESMHEAAPLEAMNDHFPVREPVAQQLPSAAPNFDPASHLKRMLSVGQANQALQAPDPALANANYPLNASMPADARKLLSLFQSGPNAESHPRPMQPTTFPPQTPLDQINTAFSMPQSPRHHQPRPAHFSSLGPPPSFPSELAQVRDGWNHPQSEGPQRVDPLYIEQHSTHRPVDREGLAFAGAHAPAIRHQGPPKPYQRMDDPQFTDMPQVSETHSSIPPASNLPAPKLSQHALGLLGALTSRAPRAVHAPANSGALPTQGLESTPETVENRSNNHQEALLRLFQSSSKGQQSSPLEIGGSQVGRLPPVELAAAPSPGVDRGDFSAGSQRSQAISKPQKLDTSVGQSKKPKSGLSAVSATISGPLPTPEFESVRKQKPSKGSATQTKAEQQPRSQPPQAVPIQILKRPTSSKGPEKPAPVAQPSIFQPEPKQSKKPRETSKPEKLNAEQGKPGTPKPFQPTILRRPQALPNAASVREASTSPQTSSQDAIAADPHKDSLLSLFRRPKDSKPSPPQGQISPIISPVSVQSTRFAENKTPLALGILQDHLPQPEPRSVGTEAAIPTLENIAAKSRVNSLTSAAGMQRTNSMGSNAPISPLDKSFLLGYLDGVVKNAGR